MAMPTTFFPTSELDDRGSSSKEKLTARYDLIITPTSLKFVKINNSLKKDSEILLSAESKEKEIKSSFKINTFDNTAIVYKFDNEQPLSEIDLEALELLAKGKNLHLFFFFNKGTLKTSKKIFPSSDSLLMIGKPLKYNEGPPALIREEKIELKKLDEKDKLELIEKEKDKRHFNELFSMLKESAPWLSKITSENLIGRLMVGDIYTVTLQNGKIIGFMSSISTPNGEATYIYDVVIDKSYQKRRIGSALIEFAGKDISKRYPDTILMCIPGGSAGIRILHPFYSKLGMALLIEKRAYEVFKKMEDKEFLAFGMPFIPTVDMQYMLGELARAEQLSYMIPFKPEPTPEPKHHPGL